MLLASEAIHCCASPGKPVAYNIFPAATCSTGLFFVCELHLSLIAHMYIWKSIFLYMFELSLPVSFSESKMNFLLPVDSYFYAIALSTILF